MFQITANTKRGLKQSLNQIGVAVASLSNKALHSSGVGAVREICANIEGAVETLRQERRSQQARDVLSKKMVTDLETLHNTIASFGDLVESEDATTEALCMIKAETSELIEQFKSSARAVEAAYEEALKRGPENEETAGSRNKSPDQIYDEVKRSVQRFGRLKFKMPAMDANTMGKRKMVLFDAPVLPLFDGVVTTEQLRGLGVDVEPLDLYNVLMEQRIIGINPKALREDDILSEADTEEYVKSVIKALNERTGKKYHLASDHFAATKTGLHCYWIMESSKLTRLIQIAHGPVNEWGFPF